MHSREPQRAVGEPNLQVGLLTVKIATLLLALGVLAPVKPCTTPNDTCVRWVPLAGGPARGMIYSSYPLDKKNPQITRAFVLVHGTGRNADHYFETAVAAAFLARALDNTIVISPHFLIDSDTAKTNEVKYPGRGDSWRSGGMSTTNPTISSFDFMDEIVRRLADKKTFPNLTKIVIAGHSAGGQYASRYGMANKVHNTPGVSISYVSANPSTYAWPTALRPLPVGNADPRKADKEALGPDGMKVNSDFTYGPFDVAKVPNYNNWPMGFEKRTAYTAQMSDDQLKKNLVERPITYLMGQVDILPLGGFDSSAVAMAQGPTRRARGEAFVKFITDSLGARPNVMIVSECGHNDRCVYTTSDVLPIIFPR